MSSERVMVQFKPLTKRVVVGADRDGGDHETPADTIAANDAETGAVTRWTAQSNPAGKLEARNIVQTTQEFHLAGTAAT